MVDRLEVIALFITSLIAATAAWKCKQVGCSAVQQNRAIVRRKSLQLTVACVVLSRQSEETFEIVVEAQEFIALLKCNDATQKECQSRTEGEALSQFPDYPIDCLYSQCKAKRSQDAWTDDQKQHW